MRSIYVTKRRDAAQVELLDRSAQSLPKRGRAADERARGHAAYPSPAPDPAQVAKLCGFQLIKASQSKAR